MQLVAMGCDAPRTLKIAAKWSISSHRVAGPLYIRTHTHTHTYTHLHTHSLHMYTYTHALTPIYTYTCTHTHTYTLTHTHTYYIPRHTHKQTHTRTHTTHTHTCTYNTLPHLPGTTKDMSIIQFKKMGGKDAHRILVVNANSSEVMSSGRGRDSGAVVTV